MSFNKSEHVADSLISSCGVLPLAGSMDRVREREMVSPGDFSGWRCCLMAVQGCFAQFPLQNCGWVMLVELGDQHMVAGFQQRKGRVGGAAQHPTGGRMICSSPPKENP